MFMTSYQKFLENFDYGYINWNTAMQLPSQNPSPLLLFNNCYALHRKDQFAISNNFNFVSLAGNPQFKVKILEQYQDTMIWIFLQKHSAVNDYQKQLAFNVYPKRFSKASVLSTRSAMIQRNFKKQIGQRFLQGKLHLNQHMEGNEVSVILTYHNSSNFEPSSKETEDVAYSLYFYSLHKLQIEELKNELGFSQTISSETTREISSDPSNLQFLSCPQFSIQPKIEFPKQKFYFQIFVCPKKDYPLSFNVYDSSYHPNYQLLYGAYPLYRSNQEFTKFDFFEGEFIISPPDLTKLNLQIIPMHQKIPKQVPFDVILTSNIKCDFARIPYDEERFETYELTGVWNNTNAGGSAEHYKANPKYLFHAFGNSWIRIQIISELQANASIFSSPFQPNEEPKFEIFSTSKLVASTTKEEAAGVKKPAYTHDVWRQISEFTLIPGGNYILIPSLIDAGVFGKYCLKVFSSCKLSFKEYNVSKE